MFSYGNNNIIYKANKLTFNYWFSAPDSAPDPFLHWPSTVILYM